MTFSLPDDILVSLEGSTESLRAFKFGDYASNIDGIFFPYGTPTALEPRALSGILVLEILTCYDTAEFDGCRKTTLFRSNIIADKVANRAIVGGSCSI